MDFQTIIRNLDNLNEDLDYVFDKVSRERWDLSGEDRENIFLKHIELATCFGLFENILSKVISKN